MKGGARFALLSLGLLLAALTIWLSRPQPCDRGVDGTLSLSAWPGNVLARLTGGDEDCDPWARLAAARIDTPFEVSWSINAYAGPAGTNARFHPDGRVEVWDDDWLADDAGRSKAITVRDPALYRLAVDLLGPLRGLSQPSAYDDLAVERVPFSPIACQSDRYHAGLTVIWAGLPGEREGPLDLSYVITDGLTETCPAQAAMGRRYEMLIQAVRDRLPESASDQQ